ncbi:hypothetical protein JL09_g6154 [Pichia kudriavzevii]|uniref:Uncharacterized protein n=1 Tax=Pichia kudriavzevii TaxID=4909 RepID=A0A099NRY1_PICKU|nr:hypothetical protein JL09_g6154 [Pichia kudriavzevii]
MFLINNVLITINYQNYDSKQPTQYFSSMIGTLNSDNTSNQTNIAPYNLVLVRHD